MSLDRDGNAIVVGNLYVVSGEVLADLADGRVVLDVKRARWIDTAGSGQPTLAVDSVDLIPRPTGGGGGPPDPHASTHENGGADEIDVAGLSGVLADPQTPATHAASHQHGGADQIATATAGANAIPKADAGGTLDPAWLPTASETAKGAVELATSAETTAGLAVQASDTRLSDARTPVAHTQAYTTVDGLATARLVGRTTAGTGALEALTLGTSLEFAGTKLQRSALTGDVTAAADDSATTIASNAVTFAKLQDLATDRLVGRDASGSGDPTEIAVTDGLAFNGSNAIGISNQGVTFARIQNIDTGKLLGRATAGSGVIEQIDATLFSASSHTHSVHGVRTPLALFTANNTANRTVTSTHTYAVYVGRLSETLTSALLWYEVVSAAVTITWAEVAIAKGTPVLNNNATLTVVGYANVAAVVNSTGFKTTTVSVSGGQSIGAGDHLWLLFGNQASTAMALRCGSVNASWSGLTLDAVSRPSSNVGTGVSYGMEDAACIWSYVAL